MRFSKHYETLDDKILHLDREYRQAKENTHGDKNQRVGISRFPAVVSCVWRVCLSETTHPQPRTLVTIDYPALHIRSLVVLGRVRRKIRNSCRRQKRAGMGVQAVVYVDVALRLQWTLAVFAVLRSAAGAQST
jgi:hypothetical protein